MAPALRRGTIVVVAVLAVGASLAAVLLIGRGRPPRTGTPLVARAAFPAAMAPLPDGGLLYAERLTGRIRTVTAEGRLLPEPVAAVDVSTEHQRGLLGVAVDRQGRVFASWTDPAGIITVARVAPGERRPVWVGPPSADVGNGGRIAFDTDSSLVIGIGDLERPEAVFDPDTPNGKLLRLDPDGPPTQAPEVVSSGWHNPFAFTITSDGDIWVADNAPEGQPVRIARGDVGERPSSVTELDEDTAPSGIAAPSETELVVCGFLSNELQPYRIGSDGLAAAEGDPLASDCSLGVVVLADGRLAYANERSIRVVPAR